MHRSRSGATFDMSRDDGGPVPDAVMATEPPSLLDLRAGDALGISGWKPISQARIDQFAAATDDFQFVHVDPVRAARETPFGGTIAHGMLTLSLVSSLAAEVFAAFGQIKLATVVSIDRVRFLSPVKADSRIRGRFTLNRSKWLSGQQAMAKVGFAVEVESDESVALSGEMSWMISLLPPARSSD